MHSNVPLKNSSCLISAAGCGNRERTSWPLASSVLRQTSVSYKTGSGMCQDNNACRRDLTLALKSERPTIALLSLCRLMGIPLHHYRCCKSHRLDPTAFTAVACLVGRELRLLLSHQNSEAALTTRFLSNVSRYFSSNRGEPAEVPIRGTVTGPGMPRHGGSTEAASRRWSRAHVAGQPRQHLPCQNLRGVLPAWLYSAATSSRSRERSWSGN
jgi:hypothetical protein